MLTVPASIVFTYKVLKRACQEREKEKGENPKLLLLTCEHGIIFSTKFSSHQPVLNSSFICWFAQCRSFLRRKKRPTVTLVIVYFVLNNEKASQ